MAPLFCTYHAMIKKILFIFLGQGLSHGHKYFACGLSAPEQIISGLLYSLFSCIRALKLKVRYISKRQLCAKMAGYYSANLRITGGSYLFIDPKLAFSGETVSLNLTLYRPSKFKGISDPYTGLNYLCQTSYLDQTGI